MDAPPGFFLVATHHDSLLAVAGDRIVSVSRAKLAPSLAVHLFRPHPESQVGVLFAPPRRGRVLVLEPFRGIRNLLPLHLARLQEATVFYSAAGGRFMTAVPPDRITGEGATAFAATVPLDYERLTLEPVRQPSLSQECRSTARLIAQLCQPAPDPDRLAALLTGPRLDPWYADALNVVAALLSPEQMRRVAEAVLAAGPVALANMQAVFPLDLSAQHALPEMIAHLLPPQPPPPDPFEEPPSRGLLARLFGRSAAVPEPLPPPAPPERPPPPRIRSIGPALDRLDTEGLDGNFVSLPYATNLALRRMARPSRRACIVATMRNEGLYLLEWLAHHRRCGFDHIFVYSNDNTDGSDGLLRALAEAGVITWIDSKIASGRRAQWKAYGHALRVLPETLDYDWCLVIDGDEFFTPNPAIFAGLGDYLDWQETREVDVIGVNWIMLGSNGEARWRDGTMARRFPRGIGGANPHIKAMFRPRKVIHSYPHHPVMSGEAAHIFRGANGLIHTYDPQVGKSLSTKPDTGFAWVAHYFFKSNEEYLWKVSRNRGDHFVTDSLDLVALEATFIRSFVDAATPAAIAEGLLVPGLEIDDEIDSLRALPGVQAALDQVKALYQARIPLVVASAARHPVMREAGEAGRRFMEALESAG
jgi:hypothetical protein